MKRRDKMTGRETVSGLLLVLCLLASMVLPLLPTALWGRTALAEVTWQIQTVDSEGNVGKYTSLAFDLSGSPAISYCDATNGDLKLVRWNGSSWSTPVVVDGDNGDNVGLYSSLAFDNSGNPAISYFDDSNKDLKCARFDGVSWGILVVEASGDVGQYSSLAFDNAGNPGISYYYDSGCGDLKYAHWNGTSWDIETVDSGDYNDTVGKYCSLAFDPSGRPAISYMYHDFWLWHSLNYAHYNGTSWDYDKVDTGRLFKHTSLAFDSNGLPGISYFDDTNDRLKYAHFNGVSWDEPQTIDSVGDVDVYTSLAFDSGDNPAIGYYDDTNGDLKFKAFNGSYWPVWTVDNTGDVGLYPSLAFDDAGNPAISYFDATNGDLKYAYLPLNQAPNQPSNTSPADGATGVSLTPTLESSAFSDPDAGDTHAASQWQVTATPGDYSSPVYDSGTDAANLTDIAIPSGTLNHNTTYYWRVRHRDNNGGWSEWSSETCFSTTTGIPQLEWHRTFGGSAKDYADCVQQTSDGGYIIVGQTESYGAGEIDVWLIKTDSEGNELWDKTFGDSAEDYGESVQQTSDGGYIIAGTTASYGAGGPADVWLIKTDSEGNKLWDKTFGGSLNDYGKSVQQTSDGGYIIVGDTWSSGAGEMDVWLIKTDSNGNKVWDETFGSPDIDWGKSVQQTADGGYVVAAVKAHSEDYKGDVWLIKTNSSGNKLWDKTFGDSGDDFAYSVEQTSDGGYIIAGHTESYGAGGMDAWLIKTDSNGNKLWDETFGGTGDDYGPYVQQTSDGGYIIAGTTESYGAGEMDAWLIKTDSEGKKLWDKTFGGSGHDSAYSVQQTSDGGYIIAGYTVSYGAGDCDVWLLKVSNPPNQPSNSSPTDGATSVSLTPTLESSAFSDLDFGDSHAASQWQITTTSGDYSSPVFDSSTDSSNLTAMSIPSGNLNNNTTYYWRLRHQDNHGAWSSWSAETSFATAAALNQPPSQPSNTWPLDGATGVRLPPILQSSAFSDPDSGDTHAASQWQITATSGYYSSPVFDSGTDPSNLTSITISSGTLQHAITYYWRVRHKDDYGNWSDWSEETQFKTEATDVPPPPTDDGPPWFWIILGGTVALIGMFMAFILWGNSKLRMERNVKRWEEKGYDLSDWQDRLGRK